ncbi:MAG: Calx-beta domain-containing protein [Cyanobacteria bacterium P01_F01_bin.150]
MFPSSIINNASNSNSAILNSSKSTELSVVDELAGFTPFTSFTSEQSLQPFETLNEFTGESVTQTVKRWVGRSRKKISGDLTAQKNFTIREKDKTPIAGTNNDDRFNIKAGTNNKNLQGKGGNDRFILKKNTQRNILKGQKGNDTFSLKKNSRKNTLKGQGGNDIFEAQKGKENTILGMGGQDTIYAGNKDKRIAGGGGNDIIYLRTNAVAVLGGGGDDEFHLTSQSSNNTINDFQKKGRDRIHLNIDGLTNFDQLTFSQNGNDKAISFNGTTLVTLKNTTKALSLDDFVGIEPARTLLPSVSIDNTPKTISEEAGSVTFTVRLSGETTEPISVNFETSGSAIATQDYTLPTTNTLTFNPDDPLEKTITIDIINDSDPEPNETLMVNLSSPNPANVIITEAKGMATILANDGALPLLLPSVSIDGVAVDEDGGTALFLVSLSNPNQDQPITIDYRTADGTAIADQDYIPKQNSLTFNPGESSNQLIEIEIIDDNQPNETDETFKVILENPSPSNLEIKTPEATAIIKDNDESTSDGSKNNGGGSDVQLSSLLGEDVFGNPEIIFDLTAATASGTRINDQDTDENFGLFRGVVQDFSYLLPGKTAPLSPEDAFFRKNEATFFFKQSGDLIARLINQNQTLQYEFNVQSGGNANAFLSYTFEFQLNDILAVQDESGTLLFPTLDAVRDNLVNSIVGFFDLLDGQIGENNAFNGVPCADPDLEDGFDDSGPCKVLSEGFYTLFPEVFANAENPFLNIGQDPGDFILGRRNIGN